LGVEHTLLTPDAVMDRATWRALLPEMKLEEAPAGGAVTAVFRQLESVLADLRREGYLNEPGVLPLETVTGLAQAASRLEERGLPPVFLWIYDAPWQVIEAFDPFLRAVLGDYRVLPEIWTWFVPASDDAAGWRPHRDQPHRVVEADGSPHSLTLWLPLSDATVLNGCLYLLPMHLDPDLTRSGVHLLVHNVQDVRALPATAGSMLVWNQNILHWGARSTRHAAGPRISMACQFQRVRPPVLGRPLIPPHPAPGFDLRVFLIARAILGYGTMTPIAPELRALALGLKDRLYEQIANAP
jgi:hypothetical protein